MWHACVRCMVFLWHLWFKIEFFPIQISILSPNMCKNCPICLKCSLFPLSFNNWSKHKASKKISPVVLLREACQKKNCRYWDIRAVVQELANFSIMSIQYIFVNFSTFQCLFMCQNQYNITNLIALNDYISNFTKLEFWVENLQRLNGRK